MSIELIKSGQKLWTSNELADEFELSKRVVRDLLIDVPHISKAGLNKLWKLKDVVSILAKSSHDAAAESDPDQMHPADRDRWYCSEQRRIKLLADSRELLQKAEVEQGLAEIFKALQLNVATLPDCLERDCMLTAEQVDVALSVCDRTLAQLNKSLLELK